MKRLRIPAALAAALILAAGLWVCFRPREQGQIYLYGERHAVETIQVREFELWNDYYHKEGMRHLFFEMPYFHAQLLNLWMASDHDEILDAFFRGAAGADLGSPFYRTLFENIKAQCPETIFHGTDIGHGYEDGKCFLDYLREQGLEHTEQYRLTEEAIEQGVYFYDHAGDPAYRENKMAENFIRAFDKLKGENVMGIYGFMHTGLDAMSIDHSVPSMANQLKARYGAAVHSVDLTRMPRKTEPDRTDTLLINGKEYEVAYFGGEDILGVSPLYIHREFWRLVGAYDDFKDSLESGNFLPYGDYPMPVETGQVFILDYTKPDGSVFRMYFRSDEGVLQKGEPATVGFFS